MTSIAVRVNRSDQVPVADCVLDWTGRQVDPVQAGLRQVFAGIAPSAAAIDLVSIAASVYAADKAVRRHDTPDGWTRSLQLHVPLSKPRRWQSARVQRLLDHLTGDNWAIRPYRSDGVEPRIAGPSALPLDGSEGSVALFSGGLDSFAFLASRGSALAALIAHKDMSALGGLQSDLAESVLGDEATDRLRQFTFWIQRKGPLGGELESSTRARSLLFMAVAIAVADGMGSREVVVPENGYISLNPALVPARRGSLSTRTTHPWTLYLVNQLLDDAGIDVSVSNPFLPMTKGDITAAAAAASTRATLSKTVSCSRARARRADPVHYGNCGYCYPCLVRRAGFKAADVKDPTIYRADPRRDPTMLDRPVGDDFKAVASGVRHPFTVHDLISATRFPPGSDFGALVSVVERSRRELVDMIDWGLTPRVRRAIGW